MINIGTHKQQYLSYSNVYLNVIPGRKTRKHTRL